MIQYDGGAHFDQYAANRANLERLADRAVAGHANIIVFPEGSSYGYGDGNASWCAPSAPYPACHDVTAVAEPIPNGPSTVFWENYARRHQVYVLLNLPETEGNRFFNTAVILGPEGYVAKYRKRTLYYLDALYATPGEAPVMINTPYGKFGILICMDVTYEGLLESYRAAGADAALLLMDWDEDPAGEFAASQFMAHRAQAAGLDLYASDDSEWDGTGKYPSRGGARERNGLGTSAVGENGITFHELNYRTSPTRPAAW